MKWLGLPSLSVRSAECDGVSGDGTEERKYKSYRVGEVQNCFSRFGSGVLRQRRKRQWRQAFTTKFNVWLAPIYRSTSINLNAVRVSESTLAVGKRGPGVLEPQSSGSMGLRTLCDLQPEVYKSGSAFSNVPSVLSLIFSTSQSFSVNLPLIFTTRYDGSSRR